MRILLLSGRGAGCNLLMRLREEGHETAVWIRHGRFRHNWQNLLQKVHTWGEWLRSGDVVLFDSPGGGGTASRLKARGYRVIGGSMFADQLEEDPQLSVELLKSLNILGVENISITEWFNGEAFSDFAFWTEKRTHLLAGDLGPKVECAGGVCTVGPPFAEMEKLTSYLSDQLYEGFVTLTGDHLSLYPPYDTLACVLASLENVSSLLKGDAQPRRGSYAFVRVSIPPYPSKTERAPIDIPVEGWEDEDRRWVYLYDVKLSDEGHLVTSGGEGLVAAVVGKSWEDTYSRVRRLKVPSPQYRIDLKEVFVASQEKGQLGGDASRDLLRSGESGGDLHRQRTDDGRDVGERQPREQAVELAQTGQSEVRGQPV